MFWKTKPPIKPEISQANIPTAVTIGTLGIPVLNRGDLLMRCLESVDIKIPLLFVINNGKDPSVEASVQRIKRREFKSSPMFKSIRVEQYENLGCGLSWNRIIQSSPGAWLISGNDIQFSHGDLKKTSDALERNQDASIVCAMGYTIFCFTPIGVKKVGFFDENFYPAYHEDVDHFRRVKLSGARAVGVDDIRPIHGEAPWWGSSTIKSDRSLEGKNGITYGNLREYYIRKWGGEPGRETYATPFGRNVPLDFWELDKDLRRKNKLW